MASELQAKLNEKQAKCQEIEQQFKELKRTVAQNAVFSRTGQKLKAKMIKTGKSTRLPRIRKFINIDSKISLSEIDLRTTRRSLRRRTSLPTACI